MADKPSNLQTALKKPLPVYLQLELLLQKLSRPSADDHSGQKYLEIFHHLGDGGIDLDFQSDDPFVFLHP
jgi:hypothetical protein